MRRLLILLAVLGTASVANAQSLDAFKQSLTSASGADGARVTVTEHGDAADAIARASRGNVRMRVSGYRVCIFFDNGQDARAGAAAAKSLFESTFPGTKADWVYDVPYFKVSVGNCLTMEEAIVLKGRISGVFPKAFIKNEELALGDLLN